MFFTVAVDMGECGVFEYSTESILQLLQAAQAFGNTDIEEVEDGVEVPDDLDHLFAEGEEYDAWYWLNEESGEWLLVENEDEAEDEAEDEEEAE